MGVGGWGGWGEGQGVRVSELFSKNPNLNFFFFLGGGGGWVWGGVGGG